MSHEPTSPIESAPILRRLWVVVLLTCLIFTFPIAMIILLSGDVYRWKNHGFRPIGKGARLVFGGLLALWAVAVVARVALSPNSLKDEWAKNAVTTAPPSGQAASDQQNGLSACDSTEATDAVKDSLENGATSRLVDVKVLDFGNAKETFFEKDRNLRRCVAQAALNTGQTIVTYQVYLGPSGKQLVQVQTGRDATMQFEVDKMRKEDAEAEANRMAAHAAAQTEPPAQPSDNVNPPTDANAPAQPDTPSQQEEAPQSSNNNARDSR